jgi:hypothetical protein
MSPNHPKQKYVYRRFVPKVMHRSNLANYDRLTGAFIANFDFAAQYPEINDHDH